MASHGRKKDELPGSSYDQNKPDIFFNYWQGQDISDVQSPLWLQLAGGAEVKASGSVDMMLPLLIQLARYQLFLAKCHAATGELWTFTQCRDVLRVFYFNSCCFGSSRAMSFADEKDYENIVLTILYFSGPCHNILPVWAPTEGMIIKISGDDRRHPEYKLGSVTLLDSQHGLWGRRTAVWSCEIDPKESQQGRLRLGQGEALIIKLSWKVPRLKAHERLVYRHIMKKQEQGVLLGAGLHIPISIGSIEKSSREGKDHGIDTTRWKTHPAKIPDGMDKEHLEATTLVTKCIKAVEVFGLKMKPRAFLCYFRRFFSLLRYLATCEIHYRDVNPGNILCDAETHTICILADFDFSRIGMLPRGCNPEDGEAKPSPHEASLDDSISGSLYFMSRRVQNILALRAKFDTARARVLVSEKEAKTDPLSEIAVQQHEDDKRQLEVILQQITALSHSYIDDAESTIYNMLWFVAFMTSSSHKFPPPDLRKMHTLTAKEDIWNSVWIIAKGMNYSRPWADAMKRIVAAINDAQGLVQQDNDRSRTGPLKCELDCYDEIDRLLGEAIDAIDAGAS